MSAPIEPATSPADADTAPATSSPAQDTPVDWEQEAKKWEKRSKDNFAKLKEAEPKLAEYQQHLEAQKTAEQRQAEELTRWQSEAETWRRNAVGYRAEALAASLGFEYPELAVRELDQSRYLGAGGELDERAMSDDLTAVLDKYPKLRRSDPLSQQPRIPAPNRGQGTSATPPPVNPAQEFASIIQAQIRA